MRSPHLALAVTAALVLSACSGDDDSEPAGERERPATTTTVAAPADVELERGEAVVASAGGDIVLDEATQQALVDVAQRYVDAAVLQPLADGTVGDEYALLFDANVQASATGTDRAVLTDEGIPTPESTPTVTATPVRIDALAGPDGTLALLAGTFELDIDAESASGPVGIRRATELTLAPGTDGNWLVSAYRVTVERDLPDAAGSTTTTAAAG